MRLTILVLGAALLWPAASATTYLVRPDGLGDFPFIQDAINAAVNGDVIELGDGIFAGPRNWNLDYLGKAITIRAQSGVRGVCIIDCWNLARGVIFQSGEGPQSRLEGVTILNGNSAPPGYFGGGCLIQDSSPTIADCEFSYCSSQYGGGAFCGNASPTFTNCTFRENAIQDIYGGGGGIYIQASSNVSMSGCVFESNWAATTGGGAHVDWSTAAFSGCTFSGNSCATAGAGVCAFHSQVTLVGCTLVDNEEREHGPATGVISCYGQGVWLLNTIVAFSVRGLGVWGEASLECCDLFGNEAGDWVGGIEGQYGTNGNIGLDPQLCDASGGDFTLEADSPCGPDFNPDCGLIGAFGIGRADAASVPEPPEDEPPAAAVTWGGLKAMFR
jgi:hypothetical protein